MPERYQQLPSAKRVRVGLLQDGDGLNQVDKFFKTGLLDNDEEFSFIPLNLDEGYQKWGKVDIIVQKLQSIVPVYNSEESQLKIQALAQYLRTTNTPIIDSPTDAMIVQNRLLFLLNLKNAVHHLQLKHPENEEIMRLRCPKFFDFRMPSQPEEGTVA